MANSDVWREQDVLLVVRGPQYGSFRFHEYRTREQTPLDIPLPPEGFFTKRPDPKRQYYDYCPASERADYFAGDWPGITEGSNQVAILESLADRERCGN